MKQVRRLVLTWPAGSNTAIFYHPLIPGFPSHATAASSATVLAPVAGTIRNLCVQLVAAVGGGDAVIWTFRKNGADTALTVTVTDPAMSGSDTTHSVALAAGDSFVMARTGSGLPAAGTAMLSFEWEPDDGVTSIYGFGGQQDALVTSTYRDGLLDGGGDGNGWGGSADQAKTLIGLGGTVTGYYVELSAAPGAGDSRTFVIYKNGTAQDGTGGTPDTRLTISESATSGNVAFSLAVVSGDYLHIQATSTGTPATTRACGSVTFTATTPGRWHVGAQCSASADQAAVRYLYPSGSSATWSATESQREHIAGITPFYLAGMIGRLQVAPGSGKSMAFTLRKNQADSTQTITFSDTDTEKATTGDPVLFSSAADELSLAAVPTNTPTVASAFPKVAWYGYEVPTTITGSAVFGVETTVTATRAIAFGLDGATNVLDEAGKLKIFGDFEVTGDVTMTNPVLSNPESLMHSIVTTGTEIVIDSNGNVVFVNG